MKIKIVRIDKELPPPEYHTSGAAAFDMYSRVDATIEPGGLMALPSNLIIEVPAGHVLLISPRSSTPRRGITFPNSPGVIDQDYHGPNDEIKILMYNFTKEAVSIKRGERIAQALIVPVQKVDFQEVEKIKDDSRGGFGSTG